MTSHITLRRDASQYRFANQPFELGDVRLHPVQVHIDFFQARINSRETGIDRVEAALEIVVFHAAVIGRQRANGRMSLARVIGLSGGNFCQLDDRSYPFQDRVLNLRVNIFLLVLSVAPRHLE